MNWKQIGFGLVLADFAAFTGWVVWQYGYVGLFEMAMANAATIQVSIDLVLACSVAMYWIWNDARARNVNPWPYLVTTTFLGSIGLLAYVVRRAGLPAPAEAPRFAHAVRA
jgi:hypothetical protein